MKATLAGKNNRRRNTPKSTGKKSEISSDPIRMLAAKLHCPSILPKRVQRPHLLRRLNDGSESGRRITLVSAPAGFGKTTCVSEWVNALGLPVTWLSLDPADDDLGAFSPIWSQRCRRWMRAWPGDRRSIARWTASSSEVLCTTLCQRYLGGWQAPVHAGAGRFSGDPRPLYPPNHGESW